MDTDNYTEFDFDESNQTNDVLNQTNDALNQTHNVFNNNRTNFMTYIVIFTIIVIIILYLIFISYNIRKDSAIVMSLILGAFFAYIFNSFHFLFTVIIPLGNIHNSNLFIFMVSLFTGIFIAIFGFVVYYIVSRGLKDKNDVRWVSIPISQKC